MEKVLEGTKTAQKGFQYPSVKSIFGRLGDVTPDCHMYRGGALLPKSLYSYIFALEAQCNTSYALYLEHGSYGSTKIVAFLMDLFLISKGRCRLFRMKHFFGGLQELKGLPPWT